MIKDFVPARTSLASGIVIKQHILERNKYPQPQVNNYSTIAYYASGSANNQPLTFQDISVSGTLLPQWNDYNAGTVENFDGGTAGVFEMFNGTAFAPSGSNIFNLTQSWSELIPTISGSVNVIHNSQDEFYNGEFNGSVLTVTTQSLNAPYPNDVIDFIYTPVRYSPQNYGLTSSDPFAENQFLNALTVPDEGEILLLRAYRKILPDGSTGLSSPYVKIHKLDNSGFNNDIALGQATRLRIKYTTLSDYVTIGDILEKTEYPTYWLYKVQSLGSDTADNYILDYKVSASNHPITTLSENSFFTLKNYGNVAGNTEGFFTNGTGLYSTSQTSNVALQITASITTSGSQNGTTSFIYLKDNDDIIASKTVSAGANITTTITGSYFPLLSSNLQLVFFNTTIFLDTFDLILKSGSFLVTQSIASSSQEYDSVIIEPYITEPNFYNSDNNALLNSVNDQRESTFALDADYGYGTTPINFSLLITGSATPATVPDSNYTSKKSTILKYEGSKSTSQLLNTWTQGDTGTYGKLPTVESLKTYIAYCDGISGWPPEHENASAMNVIYLIKADGTVVIPNTSKDSLSIMQQTFQTGEKVFISTKNISTSPLDPYRTVIRGGSHIEPILYTQFGQLPNVTWNTTMSFEDIVLAPSGNIGNYQALYTQNQTNSDMSTGLIPPNTITQVTFPIINYGNSFFSGNGYQIPQAAITDGVNLSFTTEINIRTLGSYEGSSINVYLYIYKNGSPFILGDGYEVASSNTFSTPASSPPLPQNFNLTLDPITIPNSSLTVGDIYTVYYMWEPVINSVNLKLYEVSFLQVSQYPIFTLPVTSSGANSIWNWGNKTTYPYIITSSQTTLVELYGNPNVKAKDITGSGFNTIQSPWKINYGDEFKFEGREDWSYMVKNIYAPADSGSGRIFQTGSIEVHFNANLPVSASSSVFNLDHFLIRRYVDDAAQNVITGFRPPNSEGPYLIKPEFVVPELNKSIDKVILDLTQKGLIT
jgi:hypothetical protein